MVSDRQLITDYLASDEKSLEILIKRYLKPIYSFVYQYAGNEQEAEDITQEVFVKVWRNLKKPALYRIYSGSGFNPKKGSFKAWIFSIAKNVSIDFLRKSRSAFGGKKALPLSDFENKEGDNFIADTIADPSPLPQEIFERKETSQMLAAAMGSLSPKYRTVLFSRYNDHLTFKEIAELAKEPLNTVKSRYRRALIMLRKILYE